MPRGDRSGRTGSRVRGEGQLDKKLHVEWRSGARSDHNPEEEESGSPRFWSSAEIRAVVQAGTLSPRQGELVEAYATMVKHGAQISNKLWRDLGQLVGVSGKTARRDVRKSEGAIHRLMRAKDYARLVAKAVPGSYRVVRMRPRERKPLRSRVYRVGRAKFGLSNRTILELVDGVPGQSQGRRDPGYADAHVTHHDWQEIPISRMRGLLAALVAALHPDIPSRDVPTEFPQSPDWLHNLEWARTRLRGRIKTEELWSRLSHGCKGCPQCNTPILAGCRLDGHLLTKARKFCDRRCQMRWERRRGQELSRGDETVCPRGWSHKPQRPNVPTFEVPPESGDGHGLR